MDDPEFLAMIKKFDMFLFYLNPDDAESADRRESEKIGKIVQKLGLQKK
jgi:tripartite-type tricarboxylate transporter receptor subunit TctC